MSRRIISFNEKVGLTETIQDHLRGLPVVDALDVLRQTERALLFNSTAGKPEDCVFKNHTDLEEFLARQSVNEVA